MNKSTLIQLPLPIEGATVEIPLTQGYTTIVDAIDADLASYKWYSFKSRNNIYACRKVNKYGLLLHREVLTRIVGRELTEQEYTDHVNGNGLDNRRSNLRIATHEENQRNSKKRKTNMSGFKGVHWKAESNKWCAHIQVSGKSIHLGYFDTPEEAYAAYCEAAKEWHGEFARLE